MGRSKELRINVGSLTSIKPNLKNRKANKVNGINEAFEVAKNYCVDKDGMSIMTECITINPITLAFSKYDAEYNYLKQHKKKHQINFCKFLLFLSGFIAGLSIFDLLYGHYHLFTFKLSLFVSISFMAIFSKYIYSKDYLLVISSTGLTISCLLCRILNENDNKELYLSFGENDLGFIFLLYCILGTIIGLRFIISLIISGIIAILCIVGIVLTEYDGISFDIKAETITYVIFGFYFFNMILLRKIEIQERKDFRLTNRLAAENVNVKMEMENLSLFKNAINYSMENGEDAVSPGGPLSPSNRISANKIDIIETIGSGSYADVMKGKYKATVVAIKKIRDKFNEDVIKEISLESSIMADLRHPNVVMFMGICLNPPMLVMEYCSRNTVHNVIHIQKIKLDWSLILRILLDAAHGMAYLHKHDPPIVHRDLKSLNLLLDENWRCKVSDFGLSKLKKINRSQEKSKDASMGTLPWLAPELVSANVATEKSDVYSFGVIMFELISKRIPFDSVPLDSIPFLVSNKKRPTDYVDESTIKVPTKLNDLLQLMKLCWSQKSSDRPDFGMIIEILEQNICEKYFGRKIFQDLIVFPGENEDLELDKTGKRNLKFNIKDNELILGEKIGGGSYGSVYAGTWVGTKVAIKQLFINSVEEQVLDEFQKECDLMRQLRHPNIVLFLGSSVKEKNFYLVTEMMAKGSFFDIYHNEERLKDTEQHYSLVMKVAKDMAKGMAYLHGLNQCMIHRDLKSPNIMVDEHWNSKIGDFGLSTLKDDSRTMTKCGSPLWVAPEVLKNLRFTEKIDVYSYAIIVWEAMSWTEPYPDLSSKQVMKNVATKGLRPTIPIECPTSFRSLLSQCWNDDPDYRPSFPEIIDRLDIIEFNYEDQF